MFYASIICHHQWAPCLHRTMPFNYIVVRVISVNREAYDQELISQTQWMDTHETHAKYNIAETCVASISLGDLRSLSEDKTSEICSSSTKLTYGTIRGSEKLRTILANLYSARKPFQAENILITPGAVRHPPGFLSLGGRHSSWETCRKSTLPNFSTLLTP